MSSASQRGGGSATGQGSKSANVRLFNERVILDALRRLGQASKADLSRYVGLTNNTAGVIVKDLEERKLVRAEGTRACGRGLPATLLSLDPEGAYAIGISFGRRLIDVQLVDFSGRALGRRHHELDPALPDEALALALEDVADLRRTLPQSGPRRMAGIGIAMPYDMGSWRHELDISSEAFGAWDDTDIAARIEEETGLPVFCENDDTAAAIAEIFKGAGRDLNSFVYVFIGAAIGGGIVLNGQYYRGTTGYAGDIGLMPVQRSCLRSAPAPTRPYEILLTRASVNSLIRHLRACGVMIWNQGDLEAALHSHPGPVAEWLGDCADALIVPLLSVASLLDVDAIVLDGDLPGPVLADLLDRLAPMLAAAVPEARRPPSLVRGRFGREAGALGAAFLPLHLNYSPNREMLVNR
jgi:predicted NBD/HSP70 family sugar kinase